MSISQQNFPGARSLLSVSAFDLPLWFISQALTLSRQNLSQIISPRSCLNNVTTPRLCHPLGAQGTKGSELHSGVFSCWCKTGMKPMKPCK